MWMCLNRSFFYFKVLRFYRNVAYLGFISPEIYQRKWPELVLPAVPESLRVPWLWFLIWSTYSLQAVLQLSITGEHWPWKLCGFAHFLVHLRWAVVCSLSCHGAHSRHQSSFGLRPETLPTVSCNRVSIASRRWGRLVRSVMENLPTGPFSQDQGLQGDKHLSVTSPFSVFLLRGISGPFTTLSR